MLDFKQTGLSRGILVKTRNIQFHENSFSISPFVTFRWTDRKEKEQKYHLLNFHSRSHPKCHTVNVYCCRLLLTNRHSDCYVQRVTVQHIYCTETVKIYSPQLKCTYSNYTEAAVTCSAAQQHSTFTVQTLYKLYSL